MNIFQQDSYKQIIIFLGKSGPTGTKGFFRKLSEHLNVHATYISQVLSGSRDFSEEQLIATCDYLGLEDRETEFTLTLLKIERAGSKKLREFYQQQLQRLREESIVMKARSQNKGQLKEQDKAVFYSSWHYSAVHMMSTYHEKPTFSQIQDRLGLTRNQAQQIIRFLLQTQMIKEKNGFYSEGPSSTYLEKSSPYLYQHHVNWRLKALEKFPKMNDEDLMYTSNFSMSKSDFTEMRSQIIKLIQSFLKTTQESEAEECGQLNIDFLVL